MSVRSFYLLSKLTHPNCTHFSTVGVTLGFVQPSYDIFENESYVEVCIGISNVTNDGLECDVEATIVVPPSVKTSKLYDYITVPMHVSKCRAVSTTCCLVYIQL